MKKIMTHHLVPILILSLFVSCIKEKPVSTNNKNNSSTLKKNRNYIKDTILYETFNFKSWSFRSMELTPEEEFGKVKIEINNEGFAKWNNKNEEQSAIIEGINDIARGDLVSPIFELYPFQWFKVEVDYKILEGNPLMIVGLHPTFDKSLVDLSISQKTSKNQGINTFKTYVHSGSFQGNYNFTLSIYGEGKIELSKVKIYPDDKYNCPNGKVLIVDLLNPLPVNGNTTKWKDKNKFTEFFGFSEIELVHPLDINITTIDKDKPKLIAISPASGKPTKWEMIRFFLRKRKYNKNIKALMDYAQDNQLPILGICGGHQIMARINNEHIIFADVDTITNKYRYEFGPIEVEIIKDDPIFKNLTRYPKFTSSASYIKWVHDSYKEAESLAKSDLCNTNILKYNYTVPWYTFQFHPERNWEFSCPESLILMKNMFENWGLIEQKNNLLN